MVNREMRACIFIGRKRCNLCIEEKLCIMQADINKQLNKRTKIFASKFERAPAESTHVIKLSNTPYYNELNNIICLMIVT